MTTSHAVPRTKIRTLGYVRIALAAAPMVALLSSPAWGTAAQLRVAGTTQAAIAQGQHGGAIHHRAVQATLVYNNYSFPSSGAIGTFSTSNIVDINHTLYGLTTAGGFGSGTLFKIFWNLNAPSAGVLYNFGQVNPDGAAPEGTLLNIGTEFYGTTSLGGTSNGGGAFKLHTDGTLYQWHDFSSANIAIPNGPLLHKGSRNWGVSQGGGNGYGTVYSVNPGNLSATICHAFNQGDGASPIGNLVNWGGNLYGVTMSGGNGAGVVFKIKPNCQVAWTYSFGTLQNDGAVPEGGLVMMNNRLYGTTAYGGLYGAGTIFSIGAAGGPPQIIYNFKASGTNGTNPSGELSSIPSEGLIRGTTQAGGGTTCTFNSLAGCGTVYQFQLAGYHYSNLYTFQGGSDGADPVSGLRNDPQAYGYYGTTLYGGSGGAGTVWELICPSCQ
jgi:uncharacterized repeat protein (TIGR03803 family)